MRKIEKQSPSDGNSQLAAWQTWARRLCASSFWLDYSFHRKSVLVGGDLGQRLAAKMEKNY